MKLPNDSDKYLSSWKYLELARFVPKLDKVIRIKKDDRILFSVDDIAGFRVENNNTGLYTSIWYYNSDNLDEAVRLGPLYFDLDSADEDLSYQECLKLYGYLIKYIPKESLLVYFTGKKGFHIECEPIALGINPSNNLPNIFRFIAGNIKEKLSLTSLDFSVYDSRRMWRLEGSQHQSTGLYKNLLSEEQLFSSIGDIKVFCKSRSDNLVSEQVFSTSANEWYREFSYLMEVEKERSKDFISYFNRHGSGVFKQVDEKEKIFTRDRLLQNCTAVDRLWKQARQTGYLDHEARLFLCSVLTYNDDAVQFLHEILSCCSDYNVEKSTSHITDWIRRRQLGIGGRPYTCERANSAGVGCGQCQLDERKKWIKIGDRYVETEETSSPSPVRFAYQSLKE